MQLINMFDLSMVQFILVMTAAFLIGFSKTGINGLLTPVIPIVAGVFGGKESTGIILPMLLVGDIFAVAYYNQHAEWIVLKKLLSWTVLGLSLGIIIGNYFDDRQFKIFIAFSVLIGLILLIYNELLGDNLKVPKQGWLSVLAGVASGFTSMIGNAAGPIFSLYLLTMGMKKNNFMGTVSWYFLMVNLFKVPLQTLFWHNISYKTILLTGIMAPSIVIGALLGVKVLTKLNEKVFRVIIVVTTAISAVRLLITT